jgi:hypothetical protein
MAWPAHTVTESLECCQNGSPVPRDLPRGTDEGEGRTTRLLVVSAMHEEARGELSTKRSGWRC